MEMKAVRSGLRAAAFFLPRVIIIFRPELLPRAMSAPVALL